MLIKYFKDRAKTCLVFVLLSIIFMTVISLYGLPVGPVLYATALCMLVIVCIFIYDYLTYYKKHKQLEHIKGNLLVAIDELPKAKKAIEKDYEDLLKEYDEYYRMLVSDYDTKRTEMIDFYTLWVHQIKTPISAMSVLLQDGQHMQSDVLNQELFKIQRYVELVLGYLRIDSMSSDLKIGNHSLESMVKQAVKKYAPMFIHKKIKLELEGLDVTVLTDEKWLVFVLEQLLSNALKYTKSGTIRLYVIENKVLVIEDTGIGISAEDLPRVFEKGFTGFNGRMDKKSTGLGLYLCKKTLDKLSHQITIDSEQGKWTRVSIDLSSSQLELE